MFFFFSFCFILCFFPQNCWFECMSEFAVLLPLGFTALGRGAFVLFLFVFFPESMKWTSSSSSSSSLDELFWSSLAWKRTLSLLPVSTRRRGRSTAEQDVVLFFYFFWNIVETNGSPQLCWHRVHFVSDAVMWSWTNTATADWRRVCVFFQPNAAGCSPLCSSANQLTASLLLQQPITAGLLFIALTQRPIRLCFFLEKKKIR